jgi:hypothetical protein
MVAVAKAGNKICDIVNLVVGYNIKCHTGLVIIGILGFAKYIVICIL